MPEDPAKPAKPQIYASAFICSSVIKDIDGFFTAFKIANTFTAPDIEIVATCPHGDSETLHLTQPIRVSALLMFWSDEPVEFETRFQGKTADGGLLPGDNRARIALSGGVDGYILNVSLSIDIKYAGDLWFEVYVDDGLATKLPFRIIRTKPSQHQPSAPAFPTLKTPDSGELEG